MILSSESIDSETTAHESVENVIQSPVGVSEKLSSDTPTNTERTNLKSDEILQISKSDGDPSEHKIEQEKIVSNINRESELLQQQQREQQQPQATDPKENVEIPEQKITAQKSSDNNE